MNEDQELFEEYKSKFKDIITSLINNNNLKEAEEQIKKYKEIVKNDIDIISMEVVIDIKKNNLEEALKKIDTVLNMEPINIDMLYNKAYIYWLKNDFENAIMYYKKVFRYTDDNELKNEVKEILLNNYNEKLNKDDIEKFRFIVLCPGWGKILKRSHHIATKLSEFGYDVHSISLNSAINNNLNDFFKHQYIYKGVNIHTIVRNEKYNKVLNEIIKIAQKLIDESNNKVVFITQNPNDYAILEHLKGDYEIVYECVDDNTDLENAFWADTKSIDYEQEIMNKAVAITTVSTSLYMNKRFIEDRENVYLLKNAVNKDDFNNVEFYPEEFNNIPKPIILHVGVVYDRFDEELLYKLVRANRDKSFVMIGPINNNMLKEKEENLYVLGPKEHNQLKNYISNSDIGIVPLKDYTDMAINCDSIKVYEYLAAGIPVITTKLPDVCLFNEPFIETASNVETFNNAIHKYLNNGRNYKNEIKSFLDNNSWSSRVEFLIKILNGNIDKEKYHRAIIKEIRNRFEIELEKEYNPSIESSYGMTYFYENINKCEDLLYNAYRNRDINHTYRNYIQVLFKQKKIEQIIKIMLNKEDIKEEYKAELICLNKNIELKKFIIKLLLKDYNYLKKNLDTLYTGALYNFEIENYEKSNELYSKLCEDIDNLLNTPIVNLKISKMLAMKGLWKKSEEIYFNSLKLVDKFLNKEDRVEKHKRLFDIEVIKCYICGNIEKKIITTRPDGVQIVKCKKCGLTFTGRKPSENNLKEIYKYENYYNGGICGYRFGYDNLNKELMFKNRIKWINSNSILTKNILDIGCSTGDFLEKIKVHGWETSGVEISDYAYKVCEDKGINIYNKPLRECNIDSEKFDCITMWSVLEHYTDPIKELEEVFRILKNNGRIYISVPNNTRATIIGEQCAEYNLSYEHLLYFDIDSLIKMLIKVGFKIEQCFYGDLIYLYDMKPMGTHIYVSAKKELIL